MDSDQTTLNKTTGTISVLRAARSRVTSIQVKGESA